MPLDDLDFLLLDLAVDSRISLSCFNLSDVGIALNRKIPRYSFHELTLALQELFERGDAVAFVRKLPSGSTSKLVVPTRDEIEAGQRGAFELFYELTPRGGARWETVVQPDWSLYLSSSEGRRLGWSEAQSREYLEYWIEVERFLGRIGPRTHWTVLRPWRPVYWKRFPAGYRVQYQLTKDESHISRSWSFPAPPWGLGYTPQFHRGPSNLIERKERRDVRSSAREISFSSPDKLIDRILGARNARRRFQTACEYAPRLELQTLLRLLCNHHGEVRFAAIRELARRRQRSAVKPLLSLLLRQQNLPALWALGEIADERALGVLEMLLEYSGTADIAQDSPWRGTLVRAHAQYGDSALPVLERTIGSEYPTASLAVRSLGLIGSDAARRLLEQQRGRAAATNGATWEIDNALGREAGGRTPEGLARERLRRATVVASRRYEASPHSDPIQTMVDTLRDPDPARRRAAVDLLVEYGARDRLRQIAPLAKDPEWEVRASAAYALQQLRGDRRVLRLLAKDPHPAVRWLAKKRIIPYTI